MNNLSPLQKRLLPSKDQLSQEEITLAFYPLKKEYLFKKIISEKRFEKRIMSAVLTDWNIDLDQPSQQFEDEHILQSIIGLSPKTICYSLGLAWNSNLIARNFVKGEDRTPEALAYYSADDLKFALKFRPLVHGIIKEFPTPDEINSDGEMCFAAWVDKMPENIQNLLRYSFESRTVLLPDQLDMSEEDQTKRIVFVKEWALQTASRLEQMQDEVPTEPQVEESGAEQ